MRDSSPTDRLLNGLGHALQTLFASPPSTQRTTPARDQPGAELAEAERGLSVRLLRVDHTGEICAQALYEGQALTAGSEALRQDLERAGREEGDHLRWCEDRIHELNGTTSLLDPAFYAASFLLGAGAGALGDRWSLGFLAETEHQVTRHLDDHLKRISPRDGRSRAVLEQMREDEQEHERNAVRKGGAPLPEPIRKAMGLASKVMTGTTYWI